LAQGFSSGFWRNKYWNNREQLRREGWNNFFAPKGGLN